MNKVNGRRQKRLGTCVLGLMAAIASLWQAVAAHTE